MRFIRTTIGSALALAALGAGIAIAQTVPMRPDRNASVTRADAQARAEAMFARLDANHDGRLTEADRASAEAARGTEMFNGIDTDHNGSISRAEWDAHHAAMAARHGEDSHMGAASADANGDAMAGLHGRGGAGRRGGGDQQGGGMMLRRADINGDQAVDRAEFVAAALQRFDAADSNHDGTLSADERAAVRGAMRGRMGRGGDRGPMGDGALPPPPPPAN